jgi:hypothetical protein
MLWIDYDAYAHRVFAGADSAWLKDPNCHVSALAQAHGVLPSDVLAFDVTAPLAPPAGSADTGVVEALQSAFDDAATRAFVAATIDALSHRFADRVDIVLKAAAPRDLLRRFGLAGPAGFDDLDDVGLCLTNFIREFADRPISAVLVTFATAEAIGVDDGDTLEPLLGAAEHYGWPTVYAFEDRRAAVLAALPEQVKLVLLPDTSIDALAELSPAEVPIGCGLTTAFWRGDAALPPPAGRLLLYGRVPADAEPEVVVARARSAREMAG